MHIDRDVPIPLYYQIAEQLRERIQSGDLRPGQKIPAERQLTELFGVSRMTVHQAISCLVQRGVLTVRRGAGTFVTEPKLTRDTLRVIGFEEEVARQGGTVTSLVLEQSLIPATDAVRAFLGLSRGEEVYQIVRARKAWDTVLLLETSHIPAAMCPGLTEFDFSSRSLYAVLEEEYGLTLLRSDHFFEAGVANEYEAELFEMPLAALVVLSDGVTFSAGEAAVEYCRAVYRGDRFQFYTSSNRTGEASPLYLKLASHKGMVP